MIFFMTFFFLSLSTSPLQLYPSFLFHFFPLLLPFFGVVGPDQFQTFRKLSHEPVHTHMPSSGTPMQLTLLSCPDNTPKKRAQKGVEYKLFTLGLAYLPSMYCYNPSLHKHFVPFYTMPTCLSSALRFFPLTHFLSLQQVPDVAVKVVISSKYESAWHRQGQGRHSTVCLIVLVAHHLLISANVKYLEGTIVWASHKSVSIVQVLEGKNIDQGVIQYSWAFHTKGFFSPSWAVVSP